MRAILGLGSNQGGRLAHLRGAVRALSTLDGIAVAAASPIYESAALLPPDAPQDGSWDHPFLNLALECDSALEPESLLAALKELESRLGREALGRWAPRRIDIDILAIEGRVVDAAHLRVPHAGLLERPFALLPLLDLWPEWEHPSAPSRACELGETWRSSPVEAVPSRTQRDPLALCELVGIVNVTPDSFSDGGRFLDPQRAVEQARVLFADGATLVDIGAESTRPGSAPLGAREEWDRLAPVIEGIEGRFSVDTRHAETAVRAIHAGAAWINDVEGLEADAMRRAVASSSVDVVVMHSLGIPPDRRRILEPGRDPVAQLLAWGHRKLEGLEAAGIERSRVILDPGIGFGKLALQSWLALAGIQRLHELGARLLVGHSRKSFLGSITARPARERDLETGILSTELARRGVHYLRVHDVESSTRALRTWARLDGVVRWR